jgi:hypothetical protein
MKCPKCTAPLEPHERFGTESLVCGQCLAIVAVTGAKPRLLSTQVPEAQNLSAAGPLALGAQGTLRGVRVEVIGILERADGTYSWYEYAIADDDGKVRWLWVDRGHFSLSVCEGKDCVTSEPGADYRYAGERLRLYQRGTARVTAATGEFPFEVDRSDKSKVVDYIAPPYAASYEDKVWWVFEYLPIEEIERGFAVSCPAPSGIGINQQSPYGRSKAALAIITLVALIALGVVHLALGRDENPNSLVAASIDLSIGANGTPRSYGPFRLERRWNALDVVMRSPVSNAWSEVTLALVDQENGRSFWTSQGVEYYHGFDSDGPWSEGSNEASTLVRSVPAGTYMLLATGQAGTWNDGSAPPRADVFIYERPAPGSNLVAMLLATLLIPAFYLWRSHAFEVRRWADSDYSPYGTEDT